MHPTSGTGKSKVILLLSKINCEVMLVKRHENVNILTNKIMSNDKYFFIIFFITNKGGK